MTEEDKPTQTKPAAPRQSCPQFISKLLGKKVTIPLVSGGQPITGTLDSLQPL